VHICQTVSHGRPLPSGIPAWRHAPLARFAARLSGLAFGLALAVRPAGLAEAPGSRACPKGRAAGAPLTLEGPARTMRGAPVPVLWPLTASGALGASDGLAVVLAGAAAGYGGDRRRPVTGETVRGSSPRRRACVRRTRRKLPPRNGETQGEPQPPTAGHPGVSFPLDLRAPLLLFRLGPLGPARRRCALEAVEKVVTA
jgi:hypothetical protein